MVNPEIIAVVKKYLQVLAGKGIPVQHAFLYGSHVRNQATDNSDIDVMLVSDYFDKADIYRMATPWRVAADVDHRIEPVSVSTHRFVTDEESPLIAVVKQEGVEVTQ